MEKVGKRLQVSMTKGCAMQYQSRLHVQRVVSLQAFSSIAFFSTCCAEPQEAFDYVKVPSAGYNTHNSHINIKKTVSPMYVTKNRPWKHACRRRNYHSFNSNKPHGLVMGRRGPVVWHDTIWSQQARSPNSRPETLLTPSHTKSESCRAHLVERTDRLETPIIFVSTVQASDKA